MNYPKYILCTNQQGGAAVPNPKILKNINWIPVRYRDPDSRDPGFPKNDNDYKNITLISSYALYF